MKCPDVSFIIPVLKPGVSFFECIDSILAQEISVKFEVIIVDNSQGNQNAAAFLRVQLNFPQCKLIACKRKGPGAARNEGAKHANGNYLAFVDCDVVLEKDWLRNLLIQTTHFPYDCLVGAVIPSARKKRFLDAYRLAMRLATTKGTCITAISESADFWPCINSAACLYKRSSFLKLNGFNETLKRLEDIELSLRGFLYGFHFCISDQSRAAVYFDEGIISYFLRSYRDGLYSNFQGGRFELLKTPSFSWQYRMFFKLNNFLKATGHLVAMITGKKTYFPDWVVRKNLFNLSYQFSSESETYLLNPKYRVCYVFGQIILMNGFDSHTVGAGDFFKSIVEGKNHLSPLATNHSSFLRKCNPEVLTTNGSRP